MAGCSPGYLPVLAGVGPGEPDNMVGWVYYRFYPPMFIINGPLSDEIVNYQTA